MKNEAVAAGLSRHIAWRYMRLGRHRGRHKSQQGEQQGEQQREQQRGTSSQLVSFMSAVSVAGLGISVAILITVLSVLNGFDREMRRNVLAAVPHITIRSDGLQQEQDWQRVAALALAHPQVEAVAGLAELSGVVAAAGGSQGVLLLGIDGATDPLATTLARFMTQGSMTGLGAEAEAEASAAATEATIITADPGRVRWRIVLGHSLARRLGVGVGDTVDVFSPSLNVNPLAPLATFRAFEVAGIFRVGSQQIDRDMAFVNLADARALFRLRGPHNALRLHLDDVLEADRVLWELTADLPPGFGMDSWTAQFGAVYENILFSRSIIAFMLWLLVAVAAFNLVVSLIMIVRDKKADIAILRALGASPRLINRIFVWQGGLVGLFGLAGGLVLGILGALSISDLASMMEQALGMQIFSAEVYPIDFLPSELRLADILLVSTGVLALSLLATLYPAHRAAAIQPAAALRGE